MMMEAPSMDKRPRFTRLCPKIFRYIFRYFAIARSSNALTDTNHPPCRKLNRFLLAFNYVDHGKNGLSVFEIRPFVPLFIIHLLLGYHSLTPFFLCLSGFMFSPHKKYLT